MPYKNGNIAQNATKWTSDMIKFLSESFYLKTNRQLAQELGLGLTVTRTKCYELGLKRMEMEYWTDEQIEFLEQNYKITGDSELAEIFEERWKKNKKWTQRHMRKKRCYLGLHRSASDIASIRERNKKRGCFLNTTTWQTRGTNPEGTIRYWKNHSGNLIVVIKVNGLYHHYARWLYKKTFGSFKNGFVVGFKDGDNMNIVPENLEAISRAEHAVRNRKGKLKYDDEIQNLEAILKQLNQKIKKTIHETERE